MEFIENLKFGLAGSFDAGKLIRTDCIRIFEVQGLRYLGLNLLTLSIKELMGLSGNFPCQKSPGIVRLH